jgi:hypothetical protein
MWVLRDREKTGETSGFEAGEKRPIPASSGPHVLAAVAGAASRGSRRPTCLPALPWQALGRLKPAPPMHYFFAATSWTTFQTYSTNG